MAAGERDRLPPGKDLGPKTRDSSTLPQEIPRHDKLGVRLVRGLGSVAGIALA